MNNEQRWKQRFQNFERAYFLLNEVMDRDIDTLSQLEKEGVVQRFEILIELSWNVLKDYLENEGVPVKPSPKDIIRQAFQGELITDAEAWMRALKQRNLTSHTYNNEILEQALHYIFDEFYPIVHRLYFDMKKEQ